MRTVLYRITAGDYENALFVASSSHLSPEGEEMMVGYLVDATITDEVEVPLSLLEVFAEYDE